MNSNEHRKQLTISELSSALRKFKGITRKSALGELLPILGEFVYDDAGVIEVGNIRVVVSADGIVEDLVEDDPWIAGFYSVVVNVNDVVAKGARPLGYAHVLSSSSASVRRQVVKGIKQGIDKYDLAFLKGHTHPDTSYDAIDAVVVGVGHNVLSSATAMPQDSIIVAIDLDGNSGLKGWVKTFDSVMLKTKEQVLTRLDAIINIAEKKLAHACRDISGPGIVGTIGMLCESSRVGASIVIDKIPKPKNLDMREWLLTYPSTGFVLTTDCPQECIELLSKHGLTADVVGTVSEARAMRISFQGQTGLFMNFERESIFGFKRKKKARAKTKRIMAQELYEPDIPEIELLLRKVWSTAYEYPEEWRKKRILTREQISKEMEKGCHYFGIRIDHKLAGVYKAIITADGLFGEHQSVDPEQRGLGLATAMYNQFVKYAKEHNCRKIYVNTLANQVATIKILNKIGFRKKGKEYEQAKGMKVQMFEKAV